MFLRVSQPKGIIRFGVTGKLKPRYLRPYPIVQQVGEMSCHLELPPQLPRIHNIFHVSQLRKYVPDPSYVIMPNPIQLRKDLSYEEQPVHILHRREK